jgi:hypothetical protein
MRLLWAAAIACGLCLITAWACSSAKSPPVGRWEGALEAQDVMVAVRLEISNKGDIFLSAPNALEIESVTTAERPSMRQRLADELAASWGNIGPRPMDFDGRIFRKPGGVAPQMEWNPQTRQMTVVLYLGMRAALRIPLRGVDRFSTDPWTG